MDDEKFKELMDELPHQSRKEAWQKYKKKIADLRTEVTLAQEKTSKELAQRKSSYQFQWKGHKRQFNFNSGVQESIVAARSELAKMTLAGENEEVLKKATASLNEGAEPFSCSSAGFCFIAATQGLHFLQNRSSGLIYTHVLYKHTHA